MTPQPSTNGPANAVLPNDNRPSLPPMMVPPPPLRFKRGQPIVPGQGGFNPCVCFSLLCGGTCDLRMGCLAISVMQIAYAALEIIDNTRSLLEPLIVGDAGSGSASDNGSTADQQLIQAQDDFTAYVAIVSIVESVAFQLFGGSLLLTAAIKLNRMLCLVYMGVIAVSMLFSLTAIIVLSVMLSNIQSSNSNSKDQLEAWKTAGQYFLWSYTVVVIVIQSYFVVCAYALAKQIKTGEYDFFSPAIIVPKGQIRSSGGQVPNGKVVPVYAEAPRKSKESSPPPEIVE